MAARKADFSLDGPGWPNWTRQNITITVAIRLVRKYGDRLPSVKALRDDFGVSRATAFRWRAAFRDGLEQAGDQHAG